MLIGQKDLTAFRANTAPPAIRAAIQTVPQAAEDAVRHIPGARIVRFEALGHSPQVEDPATFNAALLAALRPRS